MVCDNSDRNVLFVLLAVLTACYLTNMISDSLYCINVKDRVNVLHDRSKSFKAHTCVDIFLLKWSISAVLMSFKLCEYKVPELHVSVAVAADLTIRLATTIFLSSVKIYLRAWTARAVCSSLPEVVFLAHSYDMIHWNASVLMPYLFSLVIVLINRDIKSVLWQFEHLCNILPSPCNGFLLEVIAE